MCFSNLSVYRTYTTYLHCTQTAQFWYTGLSYTHCTHSVHKRTAHTAYTIRFMSTETVPHCVPLMYTNSTEGVLVMYLLCTHTVQQMVHHTCTQFLPLHLWQWRRATRRDRRCPRPNGALGPGCHRGATGVPPRCHRERPYRTGTSDGGTAASRGTGVTRTASGPKRARIQSERQARYRSGLARPCAVPPSLSPRANQR